MKDFLLCGALLVVVFVAFGLPVGLIIAGYDSIAVVENIMLVKAAFVAWFLSVIVLASAGNK